MKPKMLNDLRSIPFMNIKIDFDYNNLKEEILKNNIWHNYHPPYFNLTPILEEIHKSYKQCAITTIYKLGSSAIVREHFARWKNKDNNELEDYYEWPIEDQQWYPTEVTNNFPLLMDLILRLTDKPILVKIVKSGPGHALGWHSHQNDPLIKKYNKPEQCILHIPIIADEDVAHIVTKLVHEDRFYFENLEYYKKHSNYFVQNFACGKIWYLNGYHQHAYKNYSNLERVDVLIYSDVRDNTTLEKIIRKSISLYTGPFVE